MICLFCHCTNLLLKDSEESSKHGVINVYDCSQCNTTIIFDQNSKILAWIFVADYKNKQYFITFEISKNQTTIKHHGKVIARFAGSFTKINPENFEKKIPTVLTFS